MSSLFGGGESTQTTTNNIDTSLRRLPPMGSRVNTGRSQFVVKPGRAASTRTVFDTAPNPAFGATGGIQPPPFSGQFITGQQRGTIPETIQVPREVTQGGRPAEVFAKIDPSIRKRSDQEILRSLKNESAFFRRAKLDRLHSIDAERSNVAAIQAQARRLAGQSSPFIEARVRPTEQRFSAARGDLGRGLGRRGVFGSLANRELSGFDTQAGQALGDQRALATQEIEGFRRALNQDVAGARQQGIDTRRGFNQDIGSSGLANQQFRSGVNNQILAQELSALGLGQQAIDQLIRSQLATQSGSGGTTTSTSSQPADFLGGVGGILTGVGGFF